MIIWLHSAAVRAGLGPPHWIVIGIVLALVFVAGCEGGGIRSDSQALVLSRRDKWAAVTLVGLAIALAAFGLSR